MKISVIMASYLETYVTGPHKSADNRVYKFIRAVDSYLRQSYKNSELIIVSDGCQKTIDTYRELYADEPAIKLVQLQKQPHFSGAVRQAGIDAASGDLMCYLDSDDMFGVNHLNTLYENAKGHTWYYYDDYTFDGINKRTREVRVEHCYIGTSSFCHSRDLQLVWKDGYGHDWETIKTIMQYPHVKIKTPEYLVCHLAGENINY